MNGVNLYQMKNMINQARKNSKLKANVIKEANRYNLKILNEEEYIYLQMLGDFDLKS